MLLLRCDLIHGDDRSDFLMLYCSLQYNIIKSFVLKKTRRNVSNLTKEARMTQIKTEQDKAVQKVNTFNVDISHG